MTTTCRPEPWARPEPSRPMASPDLIGAARHEAGHAVMAVALGYRVREVSLDIVRTEGQSRGHCRVTLPSPLPDTRARSIEEREALERYASYTLAGEAGERLLGGHAEAAASGARRDYEQLDTLLEAWPDPLEAEERDVLVAWWRVRTWHALERRWAALFLIASELLLADGRTLLGDDVLALYTQAVGPPAPPLALRAPFPLHVYTHAAGSPAPRWSLRTLPSSSPVNES